VRHTRIVAIALALLVTLLAGGCAGRVTESEPSSVQSGSYAGERAGTDGGEPVPAPAQPATGTAASSGYTGGASLPSYEQTATDRLIIRTANLTVRVEDTAKTMDALTALVGQYQGYVADSNRWYSADQLYASATLRVPAESLDAFLAEVRSLAIKVESENITGNDVTEEYADIEAQLVNLRATEVELRELLTEVRENRGSAEEILAVYRELSNVRGQIESLQGRQKYLSQMAAMSTVNIQVQPEVAPRAVVRERWNPLVTISNAASTLVEALKGLASVLIYVVILSPILLIPLGVVWLIVWLIRRGRKNRPARTSTPAAASQGGQQSGSSS